MKYGIMSLRRSRGFTLIELMMVVVIVAVLMSIAVPSYRAQVLKSHRAAAKAKVLEVASRQESYFADNKAYGELDDLGFASATMGVDANGNWIASSSTEAVYTVSVTLPNPPLSYSVTADTANGQADDDAKCATFTVSDTGQRSATGSLGTNCWE